MIIRLIVVFLMQLFISGPIAIAPNPPKSAPDVAGINFTSTHQRLGSAPDGIVTGYARAVAQTGIWEDGEKDDYQLLLAGVVPGPWYFWFDFGPYTSVTVNGVAKTAGTDYTRISDNYLMFPADAIKAGDVVEVWQRWN